MESIYGDEALVDMMDNNTTYTYNGGEYKWDSNTNKLVTRRTKLVSSSLQGLWKPSLLPYSAFNEKWWYKVIRK